MNTPICSLLVANRGEIACRVLRTARRMGIRTIAVYSDADKRAMHVLQADEAWYLGGAAAAESYLDIDKVMDVARAAGADAIHPGYGFLSENAGFARACEVSGIIFVGPSAAAIEAMGSKIEAKRLVKAAGTPVVPGYEGDDQSDAVLLAAAHDTGFPLLIKASAGGGGKGMRLVREAGQFAAELAGARREAQNAFGDDRMLIERYLTAPKHIEVQVLADRAGHTLYLGERDCSVQRRHQKVIEEAPAPTVTPELRTALGEAAVRAAASVDYLGAGTVEFISENDEFFFMEMNTRLQVEHPITEAVTGLDLVEWQLRIAGGEDLNFTQSDVTLSGHAIEARVYAENPARRFLPSTGRLLAFSLGSRGSAGPRMDSQTNSTGADVGHLAAGPMRSGDVDERIDTGVGAGDEVTVHYDPMLAKLIVHGRDRASARLGMARALRASRVAGVSHNLAYLSNLVEHPVFASGDYTTGIADELHDELVPEPSNVPAILAAVALLQGGASGWRAGDGFQLNQTASAHVRLRRGKAEELGIVLTAESAVVNGESFVLGARESTARACTSTGGGRPDVAGGYMSHVRVFLEHRWVSADVLFDGNNVHVMHAAGTDVFVDPLRDIERFGTTRKGSGGVAAPMPGQVIKVLVAPGDRVKSGDVLIVVEAMKMEHSITAPKAGEIAAVRCAEGDRVEDGVPLIEFVETKPSAG